MECPFFFTNNSQSKSQDTQEFYGFKTNVHPIHIKELDRFESDLTGLVKSIKYRNVINSIQ